MQRRWPFAAPQKPQRLCQAEFHFNPASRTRHPGGIIRPCHFFGTPILFSPLPNMASNFFFWHFHHSSRPWTDVCPWAIFIRNIGAKKTGWRRIPPHTALPHADLSGVSSRLRCSLLLSPDTGKRHPGWDAVFCIPGSYASRSRHSGCASNQRTAYEQVGIALRPWARSRSATACSS